RYAVVEAEQRVDPGIEVQLAQDLLVGRVLDHHGDVLEVGLDRPRQRIERLGDELAEALAGKPLPPEAATRSRHVRGPTIAERQNLVSSDTERAGSWPLDHVHTWLSLAPRLLNLARAPGR